MTAQTQILPRKAKGKPGELMLMIGIVCALIAPLVLVIVHGEGAEYDLLKEKGVVSLAEIVAHREEEHHHTNRKGQERTTTSHILDVRYDFSATTTYANWKSTGTITPPKYPVMTTNSFEVGGSYLKTNRVGSKRPVAFVPGDPKTMRLIETIEAETSLSYFMQYYLAMGALFVVGAVMAVVGWRKRQAHV